MTTENPARQALTSAVNRTITEGSPVFVNQPAATLPPDPEGENDNRAEWAHRAILAFESATGTDREDALCDLLADLRRLSPYLAATNAKTAQDWTA